MSIEWTTADHRISRRDGYNVYLSGMARDPFGVYYTIRPEELPKAQAAAERGCETAKKALLLLTLQRLAVAPTAFLYALFAPFIAVYKKERAQGSTLIGRTTK